MKMPVDFYSALASIRDQMGRREYNRGDILPKVMGLVEEHGISMEVLLREFASSKLDQVEKAEDKATDGLFPHDAHIALGKGARIRRGGMTHSHHMRRKSVIDGNKIAQDRAWAKETEWLEEGIAALDGASPTTTREQVIPANDNTEQKVAA